jgi:rod shape-determining protein MreB
VGIDLGTSRSAICASNGRRATLPTVVGWPKDPIARGFLARDIVFGQEALDNRLSLDLCRPLDAGVINLDETEKPAFTRPGLASKNPPPKSRAREAAAELLKHLVGLCEPFPNQKIYAAIGTPGQISTSHKQALIEAARSAFSRIHITTEPFAVAFSLNNLHHVLIVDIGAGTVDLCRVHGSVPEESDYLTLREAGDHIDRTLSTLLRQKFDKAQFTIRQVCEYKERFSTVSPSAEPILVTFPVNGQPTTHDVTDELRKACLSIVGPISKGIMQLVGTYDPEFQERLKSQIWIAGGGSLINGLLKAVEEALAPLGPSVRVRRVDDPVFAGSDGALKLAQTMPPEYWEVLV